LNYAAILPAERVQQFCAGPLERNSLAVAFEADRSAEHQFGGGIILLASIAAGNNSVGCGVEANHAMKQNAMGAERQRDISAAQFAGVNRLGDDRIAIQDVRLHALPMREKTHLQAAPQCGLAQHRELRRITPQ
jgi:hypothetical protein